MKDSGEKKEKKPADMEGNAGHILSEAEIKYKALFEQSPYGILIIDTKGNILDFNETAHRDLGYSREEFAKFRISDIDPIQSPEEIRKTIEDVLRKGKAEFEVRHKTKSGMIRDVHVITQVLTLSGQTVFHTIWRDITAHKRADEALRESNDRLNAILQASPAAIYILNTQGVVTMWNKAAEQMFGWSEEEAVGRVLPIVPEEKLEEFRVLREKILSGEPAIGTEVRRLKKDGSPIDISISAALLYDSAGAANDIMSIVTDITERKKTEEALRDSREFIESILDTVDEAFIVIDRDYRIILANSAYGRQANMPIKDIIGKHCYEISHRSDRPCYEAGEECAVRYSFEKGEPYTCVHKHYNKDGSVIYVETKSYPLKDASGDVISAIEVIKNITDKHLLEEQLLRTQKLEAVGLLAGGIAHDFNNLLQGIFGSISLARMFSDKEGKAYQMLEGAEEALNQARNLTKQLLTFSKGGEPIKKMISLSTIIHNSVKFALSGSNVNYLSSVDDGLWSVEADEGQITQVIHNVVLNASDAMTDGGTVSIRVRNVLIDEKSSLPLKKGKYVQIAIEDSGPGIPDHLISRIFDPYFTTKQKGSGLGLTTSYSIIKKHGGVLDVKSRLGAGSTFFIYLPASEDKPLRREAQAKSILRGKGRILVMDDEEIVRTVAGHMLKNLGYEVDFAENGEQATEKYLNAMKTGRPFDAVILDLTVRGGMGGRETVRKMAELDPAITAIVSSGYSDDTILSDYRSYGFKAVLSKPYEIEGLSSILHALVHTESVQ